tara:strand:+ start:230 stop:442 length:213 start_codon:yes stop_codon:yes gene_type:complete
VNTTRLRDAALATPECVAYQVTGKAHEEASKVLQDARAKFELAGLADQRAALAYHSTPEFQALKNEWRNQ